MAVTSDDIDTKLTYDKADRVDAAVMKFDRENKDGDRLYRSAAEFDEDNVKNKDDLQQYFYRAMERKEALAWMKLFCIEVEKRPEFYCNEIALQIEGHQGWATFRKYSEGYLNNSYTHLIELRSSTFVSQMKAIGFKSGKGEGGDMS